MSADTLTLKSRNFYENTRFKVLASICLGGAGMLLLGYCSVSGGVAKSYHLMASNNSENDDKLMTANTRAATGYGFASFFFILASFMFIGMAVYISPFIMGTPLEKKMVQSPTELSGGDGEYQAYDEGVNSPSAPPLNAV
jgi:hypothetical protein